MQIRISILFVFLFLGSVKIRAQDFLSNNYLNLGFSLQNPDRRAYFGDGSPYLLEKKGNALDYEFAIFGQLGWVKHKKVDAYFGFGLAHQVTTFSRIYNHSHFGDILNYLLYLKSYSKEKVILPLSCSYGLGEKQRLKIGAYCTPSFSFFKRVVSERNNLTHSKKEFQFHNIEINPFVSYSIRSRIGFRLSTRVLNIQKIDPVIFSVTNPAVANRTFENFNAFKVSLECFYRLL